MSPKLQKRPMSVSEADLVRYTVLFDDLPSDASLVGSFLTGWCARLTAHAERCVCVVCLRPHCRATHRLCGVARRRSPAALAAHTGRALAQRDAHCQAPPPRWCTTQWNLR